MTLLVGRKFVQNCSTTGSNTICLHACWPFLVRLHYMALKAVWALVIWLELIVNDLHTALAVLAVITTSIMSCRSKSQNVLFVCFSFFLSCSYLHVYTVWALCLILKLMEWTGLSPFDNLVLAYTGRWTCTVLQCPMSMLQPLVCSCVYVCLCVCMCVFPRDPHTGAICENSHSKPGQIAHWSVCNTASQQCGAYEYDYIAWAHSEAGPGLVVHYLLSVTVCVITCKTAY